MEQDREMEEQRREFIRFIVWLFTPFGLILAGVVLGALGISISLGFLIWAGVGLVAIGLLWALFVFNPV